MIKEAWQADIVARDLLKAQTLISCVANKLYPEMMYARDREKQLLAIPEMERLAVICRRDIESLSAELAEWERKAA